MKRNLIIENIQSKLNRLPDNQLQEMNDFADFLLSKIDEKITVEGIKKLIQNSKSFEFLQEDEDLYTVNDLKEKYK